DNSLEDLEQYFIENNKKKFKATQIFDWLYKKKVTNFDQMINIKKEIITSLKNDFIFNKIKTAEKQTDKNVHKYLFNLNDNNYIEAVLMKHNYGLSLCISSQVGCNMGCTFCESGRLKKIRNLETYEMVLQILQVEQDIKKRISHVVIMGIGEPFDNYDNVMKFIEIINNDKGLAIGARHITISSCGLIKEIKKFMTNPKQINLAISLHASNDQLRNQLMPINRKYNLNNLITAINEYITTTNRRITFEYIMLKDINDTKECALELVNLIKGINCYINLIAYNETSTNYKRSSKQTILKFYDILKQNRINVTIRKEFGTKVNAACGQLRANHKEE
ncbi:MAG: 23S rRNA (adenine(2503)-C(2))-methyltransferase RlmN, partial [Bacilli bacterium]